MKKSLVLALALAFVLSIGATAFAAANPFVDVPAKHWSYDAVSKLAAAKIIEGYGDGTFRGDRTMTRYEMAEVVGKAMAKSDKADAALKALIDKLAVEFAAELSTLGVRVAKLEKNASSIKFWGDARIRYQDNYDLQGGKAYRDGGVVFEDYKSSRFQQRIRLYAQADLNERVQFQGRLSAENTSAEGSFRKDRAINKISDISLLKAPPSGPSSTSPVTWDYGKFVFKNVLPLSDIEFGRNTLGLGQLLVADTTGGFDSIKVTFGKELRGFYAYGDLAAAAGYPSAVNVSALNLEWPVNSQWMLTGAALYSHSAYYPYQIYAIGASGKFNDFTWTGEWAKNTHDMAKAYGYNTAWYTSVWYKGADKAKVGSWGVYVDYRRIGGYSIDYALTTLNGGLYWTVGDGDYFGPVGHKGFGYGFNYTFAKNAVFTFSYEDLKGVKPAAQDIVKYDPLVYARAEFWF